MTEVAASTIHPSTRRADIRETGNQRNARSATQLAQLLRTANLSDWKSGLADIQVIPSSCIDSYQQLVVQGNPLQLLPAEAGSANGYITADVGALVTRHQAGNLGLRCRKLEVETTSTSNPIRYKLYFAAGFVTCTIDGQTKRAPILLIPITVARMRGRGSSYSISYKAGSLLHLNPEVAQLCSTHIEEVITPFKNTTDLREYLRGVKSKLHPDLASKISANIGILSLQADVLREHSKSEIVDIELKRTKPGVEFKPLPSTPDAFDPQLAIRLLRFIAPEKLSSALYSFAGHNVAETASTRVADVDPDLDTETLEKYHNCAGWLIDVGLGHWKLKNIATLPARVDAMIASINSLLSSKQYQTNFRSEFRTVDMLHKLNRVKSKILNAPLEMQHHAISQHADTNTRLLLQKAKIQASSLEQELELFDNTFHMSTVPSSDLLHKLIKTISKRDEESQLTNPNYFRARRTLNEILQHHNGALTDNDLQLLERLANTLKFSELFGDDVFYKRNFGSLFKGTDTNWQRLDSVVNYVQSLSQDLGSSRLVAQFADQWVSFERDFGDFAPLLDSAATGADKLCSLIPMFIDQNTELRHATATAEKFRSRVDVWQKYLHRHYADTELTPFQLLSNMDLGDHHYPNVTLSEYEFDERIYRHIAETGITPESVSVTSEWLLNVVVRLQTDTPTVRRFLDKEAELLSSLA